MRVGRLARRQQVKENVHDQTGTRASYESNAIIALHAVILSI